MWVKMRTRMTGADGLNAEPGQIVNLPDDKAQDLIAGQYAEACEAPKIAKPAAEAAVVDMSKAERAAMDPPRGRTRASQSREV